MPALYKKPGYISYLRYCAFHHTNFSITAPKFLTFRECQAEFLVGLFLMRGPVRYCSVLNTNFCTGERKADGTFLSRGGISPERTACDRKGAKLISEGCGRVALASWLRDTTRTSCALARRIPALVCYQYSVLQNAYFSSKNRIKRAARKPG